MGMNRSNFSASSGPLSRGWHRLRLPFLLGLLAIVSVYAWQRMQFQRDIGSVESLLQSEENGKAIAALESLKARFGERADLRHMLARAYRQSGKKEPFERQLELAQGLGLRSETVQAERFLFEAQLGAFESLESRVADFMVSNDRRFDDAARSLVFGLLRNQNTEAVERFLPLWENQSPSAAWIPTFRGMMRLGRRDWKNALLELEPALEKHPDFLPLYLQAGMAYQGDQQFERAEAMLDRYLQSQPDSAEGLLSYSEVLRKLGKAELALGRIETILPISDPSKPIQPALRLQIAKLYLDVDESQKVIDTLSGLAKLWPEDVEIASTLSQAYQRLGDEPRSASYAAIADSGQKQTVLADGMLFELLSNPNRTAEQCYALGHLLLHKKSRENGIYWLEAALKLDEKFAPAHQDLALYYDRTEQPQYAAIHRRYLNAPGKP